MVEILNIGSDVRYEVKDTFYLVKSKNPRNDPGLAVTTRIPMPFSCLLARLRYSSLFVNAYKRRKGNPHIYLTSAFGHQIAVINLSQEDKIAFNIKHLIGFSKNISFTTQVLFSVAALTCEKTFVHVASGPGNIVFETSGPPTVTNDNEVIFHPVSLIAWTLDTCFSFDRVYSFIDVYLNETRVSALSSRTGLVLIDADVADKPRKRNGLWRLFRSIYLPG